MKTRIMMFVAVTAFCAPSIGDDGRFQVVACRTMVLRQLPETAAEEPMIIKIDTATGRTWKLISFRTIRNVGKLALPVQEDVWQEISKDSVQYTIEALEEGAANAKSSTNALPTNGTPDQGSESPAPASRSAPSR